MKCPQCGWQSTDRLTLTEADVLALYVEGYSNMEIASHFTCSVKTIEAHMSHIRMKSGATTRNELMHWAARNGFIRAEWKQLLAGG